MALKSIMTRATQLASRHSVWCHDRAGLAGAVATELARNRVERKHDNTLARVIERAASSDSAQCVHNRA